MSNKSTIRQLLHPKRIFLPIALGLGASGVMWYWNREAFTLDSITLHELAIVWLFMAILMMLVRDAAYIVRIRILTQGKLSWRKCFDVIMLWEFASAVTPSVVGGTPIAILILNREGLSIGRSTALALATSFLDEMFYVVMVPIVYFTVRDAGLVTQISGSTMFGIGLSVRYIFVSSYCLITLYSLLIGYGLFVSPESFRKLSDLLFKLPIMKRWKESGTKFGSDIQVAANELTDAGFGIWAKSALATLCSWTARFWVVNCIMLSFILVDDHLLIYARQLIMWIVMLVSPTPGGAMFAENAFVIFLSEFIPLGLAPIMAFLWRLISYYPYLIIGGVILPGWLRRVQL